MNSIKIKDKIIGSNNPVFIIAEAGSNHNQDYNQALKLIDVAADAGADAIKFQIFTAEKIVARTTKDIASLKNDKFGKFGNTLYELFKKIELPVEWIPDLKKYAEKCGIIFSATPFDEEAVDILEKVDIDFYKIASFELVHLPLIRYAATTNKPIILSTGMANLEEISDAVETVESVNNNYYALLHCGIEYPPRYDDIHLAAMDVMSRQFNCPIGYSDHTPGNVVPVAAVARGARVIEKHFTLDKDADGPDHAFALSPVELKEMVQAIRNTEKSIGNPVKEPVEAEMKYIERGRRSLFASSDIKKGDIISNDNLIILRPGIGIMPKYLDEVIGKKALSDISSNEPITWELLE